MKYVQRGLEKEQEQNYRRLIRDVRTMGQKVTDFLQNPEAVSLTIFVLALTSTVITAGSDYFFLIGLFFYVGILVNKPMLPFRLPKRSNKKDYNSPIPGTSKPTQAAGIFYFGNAKKNKEELWFTNEDMRTHVLMFGSTGSGKTEALISIAYNSLIQSSGFIFVDGKGDNTVFAKVFSLVRYMGREDDLLLINFMTGARDIIGPQKRRLSNTMNPFARGSSSMLSQLVIQLMEEASNTPSGDMWKGRAMAFVEALMKILVAMRDAEYILLDANVVRNYFSLDRVEAMVVDKVFIRDDQDAVSLDGFPPSVLEPITTYLTNLPGYRKDQKGKQVSQVYEQHGYVTMQLVRVFTSLADTYGHILRTRLAEVDLKDVVLNRRILVVLLPALEKSPDELSNLGKVIISSLKVMMAAGLGEEVEGKYADLVQRKPTNAKTPYLCILDEYGYYAVKGFAIVPAQARSLGFSVIFAGQDLPALQKASKEEAATIGANTNIKLCMKLEDPLETWDFFMKTAGESYVSHVAGFQTDARSMANQYLDTRSAQLEKRSRIDLLDLKEQDLGEAHIFFKSRVIRARMFYANPAPVKAMRLNHLLKVDAPTDSMVRNMGNSFYHFDKFINEGNYFSEVKPESDPDLNLILEKLEEQTHLPPIEAGVKALINFTEAKIATQQAIPEELAPLSEKELSIFTSLRLTEHLENVLLSKDRENFSKPILDKQVTREHLKYVGRLLGVADQIVSPAGLEIVQDIENCTIYPPLITEIPSGPELAKLVGDVVVYIGIKLKEKAETTKGA